MSLPQEDQPCPHDLTSAEVEILLSSDTGRRMANIRIWCDVCEQPFLFADRIQVGLHFDGVARSMDGQELRVAIRSALDDMPSLPGARGEPSTD